MPHRDKRASLRSNGNKLPPPKKKTDEPQVSEFRTMNAIQVLKSGVERKMNKSKGWLLRLLVKEGNEAF
jgi:hypothetical protein